MALRAGALTTYETVKASLKLADDSKRVLVEGAIDAASGAIASHCQRKFALQTVTDRRPVYTGPGLVLVEQRPVVEILSWTLDGAEQSLSDISVIDAETGEVALSTAFPLEYLGVHPLTGDPIPGTERSRIAITLRGGWTLPTDLEDGTVDHGTLPAEVERAAIITACSIYLGEGRDESIASESLDGYSISYARANTVIGSGAGGLIPDRALPLLKSYVVSTW